MNSYVKDEGLLRPPLAVSDSDGAEAVALVAGSVPPTPVLHQVSLVRLPPQDRQLLLVMSLMLLTTAPKAMCDRQGDCRSFITARKSGGA